MIICTGVTSALCKSQSPSFATLRARLLRAQPLEAQLSTQLIQTWVISALPHQEPPQLHCRISLTPCPNSRISTATGSLTRTQVMLSAPEPAGQQMNTLLLPVLLQLKHQQVNQVNSMLRPQH